ncbi:MAG TPA: sensor domain-containing diguanylate cyclase [Actinomycetes bacterium]|nr:sensor domain-containing diguanylate cyclase [Actinomycetes bacterium]
MTVGQEPRLSEARREGLATRLGALAEIARAAWAGTQEDLLSQAAMSARDALDAASASISRWDDEVGEGHVLINEGELGPGEERFPDDEVYGADVFMNLKMLTDQLTGWLLNVDDPDQAGPSTEQLRRVSKHCAIGAPIPMDGRIWGELFLTRTEDQPCFEDSDVDLALVVAAQIGAALATANHLDNVDQLAHTDPLTGLANRRSVDEALDIALSRHRSEGMSVSLVVCDLNGLKRINDEQGHDAGDRALVRFAGMLDRVASKLPGALAARLGGDEFCIVTGGVPADTVVQAAEELCKLVLRSPLEGVSCGVASTDDDVGEVETAGRLFRLADAAQYRAKRSNASVPIVAGRALPPDVVALQAAQGPIAAGDRRMFRGRDLSDTARLLRGGMSVLDDARDRNVVDRLTLVAEHISDQCHPIGWWLSAYDAERGVVRTTRHTVHRSASQPGEVLESGIGNEYLVQEYAQTAHALLGNVVLLGATDPETDPAELEILERMGASMLLMAGITSPGEGGWLLEIYGDAMTAPLSDFAIPVRALMALAALEATPS